MCTPNEPRLGNADEGRSGRSVHEPPTGPNRLASDLSGAESVPPAAADTPTTAQQVHQNRRGQVVTIKTVATEATGPDPLITAIGDMLLAEWWSHHAPRLCRPLLTNDDPAANTRPPTAATGGRAA
jgi:hypothetical protein